MQNARVDFHKAHPKNRINMIDDDELVDAHIDDYEFRAEYGIDKSTADDWKKMRDNERAVKKQIKELSPKKTTFADRLRSHYEKKYAKEIEQRHKEIDEQFDREVDKVKNSYYGRYGREAKKRDLEKLESQRKNAHNNAYDRVMDKAVDDSARKIGGLALATTGVLIAAAYAPDLKKKMSSLKNSN